jgi:transcriptional regulator with XRE-family HTH domain
VAKTLAEVLRSAREAAELSQTALADRVGLAANHIARLEGGAKVAPRFDTVARLAVALGLSLDDIARACGYRATASGSTGADTTGIVRAVGQVHRLRQAMADADSAAGELLVSLESAVGEPRRPKDPITKKKSSKNRR